ncbi:MAG TPA: HlyD family efflux transporter periplasmic adaptor subunit [Spirochaetia bacterium]|nr:HlyD family efflux transporter periplasmic adaptor subunit [Spirochaetia bacterium]
MKTTPAKTRLTPSVLALAALVTACSPSADSSAPAQGQGQGARPQGTSQAGQPTGQAPATGQGNFAQGQGGAPGGFGGQGGTGRRSQAIVVQAEVAKVGKLTVDNSAAGAIIAETQSSVAAGVSGTVKTLLRQAGDWVETGDSVIQLDDSQLQLSLKIAQANLQNARINAGLDENGKASSDSKVILQLNSAQKTYNSAVALSKIGGIAGSDLDTAQANLEAAKMAVQQSSIAVDTASLQLQQAQLNLTYATIRSPYAGQISVVNIHPGEYVSPSTAVYGLVSRRKQISFSVAPTDAAGLQIGKDLKFSYGGKVYPAKVTQAPSAPVNGLVTLTAALPAGLNATLGTVGSVAYSVVLAEGTLVSLPALQSAENKTFVFVVNNNRVSRVEVTILAESGAFAAVSNLADNVVVVDNPPPGLLVGAQVQTVMAGQTNGQGQQGQAQGAAQNGPQGQQGQTGQRRGNGQAAGANTTGTPGGTDPNAAPRQGNFDPSKLTPEQRAQYQARRKAAADAAAAGGAGAAGTTAPSGGQ